MATLPNLSEVREASILSQVEKVREEIKIKFTVVRQLIDMREEELLSELRQLEMWYKGRGVAEQIEELNKLKELQLSNVKLNTNKDLVMQHVAELDNRVEKLKDEFAEERSLRSVFLEWDVNLENKLGELGKIVQKNIPDYKKLGVPEFSAFKHSTEPSDRPRVFHHPRSIAVHPETGDVYVCDCGNNRVQVFNTDFKFLFCFCQEMLRPDGICISRDRVYVTQNWDNCLTVYDFEGVFLKSVGKERHKKLFSAPIKFERPRGVAVSSSTIYVCDTGNNRIQCLNLDLTYKSMISDIPKPKDAKLSSETLVVLTDGEYFIHYYNSSHQLFRKIICRSKDVEYPWHFCLDSDFNILITDISKCHVAIFTSKGVLEHKLGRKGNEKGEFKEPTGIAIDSKHRIIVASENPGNCLQMF